MNNKVKRVVQYYELYKYGDHDFSIIRLNEEIDNCSIQEQREIFEEISMLLKNEKHNYVSKYNNSYFKFERLYVKAMTALSISRRMYYKLKDIKGALDMLKVADYYQCLYISELNSLDCLRKGDYQIIPNVDYTEQNIKYGYLDFELRALKQAKVIVDYYKYKGYINHDPIPY